ncbi:GDP-mannose transporter [Rhizopus microsporus ATCC 52813]|uniref:GDP-mannose transporter n=2 Tax=Rhizopus microsporus TaxID=58291 RepID=A0A2G4T6Y9_RHIZD|nr:GDP-mannose transporter [Rhizopus microsporus ATCC 52813]PHZ16759.1 GDP-mannose transporter [Rhizopus microsporus ATCC 52813]
MGFVRQEKGQSITLTVNTGNLLELSNNNQSSVVASSKVSSVSPAVKAGLPIFSYCIASIVMTVANKYVVSGDFNMVFLLLTVQSIVTILFLQVFKFLNLIKYREYSHEEAKKWYPIVIFLVAMIYTGSKALQYLPIPVYTIFKNLTIILIAYGEVLWFGGSVSSLMMLSFALMTLSSVIAGWNDVFNALDSVLNVTLAEAKIIVGYFWMAVNCLSSAAFVLYMRKRIKLTNFKDFDTVYYNNLLSIPLLLLPSLLLENWSIENLEFNFPPEERQARIWAMIFSGVSAFGMSYASAWCVRTTSSTTYSMVGSLNKLPIAISGIVFFGDKATFGNVTAIFMGFVAGIVYSYAKAFPKSAITVTSASSQSYMDASKDNEKLPS